MRWAAAILIVALAACDSRSNEWTGWAYPDAQDLTLSVSLGGFRTFEECQEATIARLRRFPEPDRGTFICGHKCRWSANLQTNVCETTRR